MRKHYLHLSNSLSLLPFLFLLFGNLAHAADDHVFFPKVSSNTQLPLVVVMHGCAVDAESMAAKTGWSKLAEEKKFAVLYPNIKNPKNKSDCFGFFDEDSLAGSGGARDVMDSVVKMIESGRIDPKKVFLTGMSAGSAMTSNLLSCYPDVFARAATHSGMSYGLAVGQQEAVELAIRGPAAATPRSFPCSPQNYRGQLMVVQGDRDNVMNPKHAERIIQDFITKGSSSITKKTSLVRPKKQLLERSPYKYTVTDYFDNNAFRGRQIYVDKLGHSWSGGEGLFTDPRGPDATRMMWEFFVSDE